jgi:hypothetical protein
MLVWLIALSCLSQQPDAANASSLKIDPPKLELGELPSDKKVVTNITLTNTGTANIRMMSLDGPAKVMLARVLDADGNQLLGFDGKGSWNRILLPGKSVTLEVTVVPSAIKGRGLKTRLTVYTDEAKAPKVPILVTATMKEQAAPAAPEQLAMPTGKLHMDRERIDFGTLISGDDAHITVILTNVGSSDLEIKSVTSSCGCTVPKLVTQTETVLASELEHGRTVTLAPHATAGLEARLISKGLFGEVLKTLTIWTNDRAQPTSVLEVAAKLEKGYVLQPGGLIFGEVKHGAAPRTSVTLDAQTLSSLPIRLSGEPSANATPAPAAGSDPPAGGTPPAAPAGSTPPTPAPHAPPPFAITEVVPPNPSLTVTVSKVEGEKAIYRIEATLTADAPASALKAPVILKTNHPLVPEIMIPVVGQMSESILFDAGNGQGDRLDFGLVKEGEGAERDITIDSMDPGTTYSISSIEVESRNAAFVKQELITVEPGRKYRLRVSVAPNMPKGYFTGTLTLKSSLAKLPKKEIKILGFVAEK